MTRRLTVVVATYNRRTLLVRLLRQLAEQRDIAADAFEVIVVDDGSREPIELALRQLDLPYALRVVRQPNAGAATARHRGARLAHGDVLLFVDDDMQVTPRFVAAHLEAHERAPDGVVLGVVRQGSEATLTLFERFHALTLQRFAEEVAAGRAVVRGPNLWTGNVSMTRSRYFEVGGFDPALGHSEDAELGVRLEKAGVHFHLSSEAYSLHDSDHTSLEAWMRRARKYGVFDTRIARKHPDVPHANPWRYFGLVNPGTRPALALALAWPRAGDAVARTAMLLALGLDRVGLERVALAGTTFAYGVEYAIGMREEEGGVMRAVGSYLAYLAKTRGSRSSESPSAVRAFLSSVRADHAMLRRYRAKYRAETLSESALPRDAVEKIGFQMMLAYRAMKLVSELRVPLAPQVVSRMIRHLYGADVHWDARLAPGVVLVHGMGLAISDSASVAEGAILFQNVTLGAATHPDTQAYGAPTVEADVHIGPGATITGPVTIGARSKVMAGCVVRRSVPPDSLVVAPEPTIESRVKPRASPERGA